MSRTHYILIFLLFSAFLLSGNDISFHKEHLDIFIKDSSCVLEGKYYLKNNTNQNISFPIYYPIAIDTNQFYPALISVFDHQQQSIKYKKNKNGVHFSVNIPADTTLFIIIKYKQPVLLNKFEYIVRSTRSWGEPLKFARIDIHVPVQYKLTGSSFSYNNVAKNEKELIYTIKRNNFFPDKNVIIEWQKK